MSPSIGSKIIARHFRSTPQLRFFPQMRKFVGHIATVKELQGNSALVEFSMWAANYQLTGATVHYVWPLSALELHNVQL